MPSENPPAGIVGILIEEHTELTLADVCGACTVEVATIVALVEEGVLEPIGSDRQQWRFSGAQLRRATAALRLQNDLGVNAAGAGLALHLLEEIERLRTQLRGIEGD
jgi:chaperone modulatory protein CbpM